MISRISSGPSFKSIPMDLKTENNLRKAVQSNEVIFADIDSQDDFIRKSETPRAGLYIEGAEEIIDNLKVLNDVSDKNEIFKINTMDTHSVNDLEFASFEAVSDGHCVKGTKGWEKVCPDPDIRHQLYIGLDAKSAPSQDVINDAVYNGKILTLEKNAYSFGKIRNAAGEIVDSKVGLGIVDALKNAGVKMAVVFGVATDICVQEAVQVFKKAGIVPIVVKDAVKGINDNVLNMKLHPVFQDVMTTTTAKIAEICNTGKKHIKL